MGPTRGRSRPTCRHRHGSTSSSGARDRARWSRSPPISTRTGCVAQHLEQWNLRDGAMALAMWAELSDDGWTLSFHREGIPPIALRGSGRPLHPYGFDMQSMNVSPRCLSKHDPADHRSERLQPGPGHDDPAHRLRTHPGRVARRRAGGRRPLPQGAPRREGLQRPDLVLARGWARRPRRVLQARLSGLEQLQLERKRRSRWTPSSGRRSGRGCCLASWRHPRFREGVERTRRRAPLRRPAHGPGRAGLPTRHRPSREPGGARPLPGPRSR